MVAAILPLHFAESAALVSPICSAESPLDFFLSRATPTLLPSHRCSLCIVGFAQLSHLLAVALLIWYLGKTKTCLLRLLCSITCIYTIWIFIISFFPEQPLFITWVQGSKSTCACNIRKILPYSWKTNLDQTLFSVDYSLSLTAYVFYLLHPATHSGYFKFALFKRIRNSSSANVWHCNS